MAAVARSECRGPSRQDRLRRTAAAVIFFGALALLAAPIWGHRQPLAVAPMVQPGVQRTIVVAPGDTLAGIARRFGPSQESPVTVAELRSELGGRRLVPGMRVQLP